MTGSDELSITVWIGGAKKLLDEMSRATSLTKSSIVRAAVAKLYEEWRRVGKDPAWLTLTVLKYREAGGDNEAR